MDTYSPPAAAGDDPTASDTDSLPSLEDRGMVAAHGSPPADAGDHDPPPPLSPAIRRREIFIAWASATPPGLPRGGVDSTGRNTAQWRLALRAEADRRAAYAQRQVAHVLAMARAAELSSRFTDATVASVAARWIDREPILFPPWRSEPTAPAAPLRTAAVSYFTLRITPNIPGRAGTQRLPSATAILRSTLPTGFVWWTNIRPEDRRSGNERP